jgi:hypothetical protein
VRVAWEVVKDTASGKKEASSSALQFTLQRMCTVFNKTEEAKTGKAAIVHSVPWEDVYTGAEKQAVCMLPSHLERVSQRVACDLHSVWKFRVLAANQYGPGAYSKEGSYVRKEQVVPPAASTSSEQAGVSPTQTLALVAAIVLVVALAVAYVVAN